jgi:hypothetical protein
MFNQVIKSSHPILNWVGVAKSIGRRPVTPQIKIASLSYQEFLIFTNLSIFLHWWHYIHLFDYQYANSILFHFYLSTFQLQIFLFTQLFLRHLYKTYTLIFIILSLFLNIPFDLSICLNSSVLMMQYIPHLITIKHILYIYFINTITIDYIIYILWSKFMRNILLKNTSFSQILTNFLILFQIPSFDLDFLILFRF